MSTAPKTLNITEQHQLLETLKNCGGTVQQQLNGIRNRCMALLMLDAGLRIGEVVRLKMSALFFNGSPVESLVIGKTISKNGEERIIPTSTRLKEAAKTMRDSIAAFADKKGDDFVFSKKAFGKHIATRQVERIIGLGSLKAFGRSVNPHVLRHTFATKLMRVTDMATVQALLGHKQLSSTQVYTHSNSDDKRTAIDKIISEEIDENSQKK